MTKKKKETVAPQSRAQRYLSELVFLVDPKVIPTGTAYPETAFACINSDGHLDILDQDIELKPDTALRFRDWLTRMFEVEK